ncbi:cobaltochelatase subunit CobN, partial [Parvimonas micra]|uniref:cobaltochelatase subunit CobN n=1 Tax=Parvimonas micra TaxID=33033 RepID=UPI002B468E7F
AQDLRAYLLCLQYWLGGSAENLAGLIALLASRYAGRAGITPPEPIHYPEMGVYHPRMAPPIGEDAAALPRAGAAGTVGVLLMRSY